MESAISCPRTHGRTWTRGLSSYSDCAAFLIIIGACLSILICAIEFTPSLTSNLISTSQLILSPSRSLCSFPSELPQFPSSFLTPILPRSDLIIRSYHFIAGTCLAELTHNAWWEAKEYWLAKKSLSEKCFGKAFPHEDWKRFVHFDYSRCPFHLWAFRFHYEVGLNFWIVEPNFN
jgi:hypothetical protein